MPFLWNLGYNFGLEIFTTCPTEGGGHIIFNTTQVKPPSLPPNKSKVVPGLYLLNLP